MLVVTSQRMLPKLRDIIVNQFNLFGVVWNVHTFDRVLHYGRLFLTNFLQLSFNSTPVLLCLIKFFERFFISYLFQLLIQSQFTHHRISIDGRCHIKFITRRWVEDRWIIFILWYRKINGLASLFEIFLFELQIATDWVKTLVSPFFWLLVVLFKFENVLITRHFFFTGRMDEEFRRWCGSLVKRTHGLVKIIHQCNFLSFWLILLVL